MVNFWKGRMCFPLSRNLIFAMYLSHFFYITSAGICKDTVRHVNLFSVLL